MKRLEKLLLLLNFLLYIPLTIFSFSQVDLNLTLSSNKSVLILITSMQKLGYYNRPLSSAIFIAFILLLFIFYIYNLWLFYKSKVSLKYLTLAVVFNVLILIFSYPFLSADIFNYMFDAKIILKYGLSPYTHKPLDFPGDEWLRFMRWTHRYSPYGPFWLLTSQVPTVLGFGKFVLTLFFFKIFIAAFHLANTYLINKILLKINAKKALFGTAFYALNPLILIEGVANGHNDVVQATFLLLPILFFINDNKLSSVLSMLLGTLIKYISFLITPFIVFGFFTKKISDKRVIFFSIILLSVFMIIYSTFGITAPFVNKGSVQVQFQPWYLFWILPLIALIPDTPLIILSISLCFGASLRYLPFLYFGDWSHAGTTLFMQLITITPAAITIAVLVLKGKINVKKIL